MRAGLAVCLLVLSCLPCRAGKLDLDLYPQLTPIIHEKPRVGELPAELWQPGTSLALRGEGPVVQTLGHLGNTAMGAWGLAQNAGGFSGNGNDKAAAIGFGLITALQLFDDWLFFRDRSKRPRANGSVDFFFSQGR